MLRTSLFEVLEARGQKQRWLLAELARRGYRLSESYLSQMKSGAKAPSPRFAQLASEIMALPQSELFSEEGRPARPRPASRAGPAPHRKGGDGNMGPINVAIVGVGNCASSLVQGVHYYRDAPEDGDIPGLMHVNLGGYLPVGSAEAAKWYAEQAMLAGCAFVNCMPEFIASDRSGYWPKRFEDAGVPIIGDDIKSQVGSTIVHRILSHLFMMRGVHIDRTYQLNFGGNTDFLNMLERSRLISKKISKTQAVTSEIEYEMMADDVHIGPSDYVPWLGDRKWAYIRLEGTSFGDTPLNIELKLEVWDSPNSAGVVIDAVRCAKLALDRDISGTLEGPSAYFMKSPPIQHHDEVARDLVE